MANIIPHIGYLYGLIIYCTFNYFAFHHGFTFIWVQCTYDPTPGASALRRRRVRAYNVYQPPHDGCAFWKSWTSYLIIDNLTLNDSGEYACSAWNEETPALKAESLTSQTLVLQIVPYACILCTRHILFQSNQQPREIRKLVE